MIDVQTSYGKELILDLHDCEAVPFTRNQIRVYLKKLCEIIEMIPEDMHIWDYDPDSNAYHNAPSHLKGISAIQFITTSSIVIHTLDDLKKVYINVFSCKSFNSEDVRAFSEFVFDGKVVQFTEIDRS